MLFRPTPAGRNKLQWLTRAYDIWLMAPPIGGRYAQCRKNFREADMLTIDQKAAILRRTGIAVPPMPSDGVTGGETGTPSTTVPSSSDISLTPTQTNAMRQWSSAVNTAFVSYVAARAAKGLREAEEARQLCRLRQMSAKPSRAARSTHRA